MDLLVEQVIAELQETLRVHDVRRKVYGSLNRMDALYPPPGKVPPYGQEYIPDVPDIEQRVQLVNNILNHGLKVPREYRHPYNFHANLGIIDDLSDSISIVGGHIDPETKSATSLFPLPHPNVRSISLVGIHDGNFMNERNQTYAWQHGNLNQEVAQCVSTLQQALDRVTLVRWPHVSLRMRQKLALTILQYRYRMWLSQYAFIDGIRTFECLQENLSPCALVELVVKALKKLQTAFLHENVHPPVDDVQQVHYQHARWMDIQEKVIAVLRHWTRDAEYLERVRSVEEILRAPT